jgi:hypothetical protein
VKFATGYRDCPADAVGTHSLDDLLAAAAPDSPKEVLDLGYLVEQKRDQGGFGTCTGFGLTQATFNCARQQTGYEQFEYSSELQVYTQGLAVEHLLRDPEDGCSLDAVIRGAQLGGFVPQKVWPYTAENCKHRNTIVPLGVSQGALVKANLKSHRLLQKGPVLYANVRRLLKSGKGIVGGWKIDGSFQDWSEGDKPWNGLRGPSEGGHCMCLQDYPNGDPRLVSSWGPKHCFYTVTWRVLDMAIALWAIDFVP